MSIATALISFILAPVAALVFAVLSLFRRTRRLGGWGLLVSAAFIFAGPMLNELAADAEARAVGFLSAADYTMAREEGIRDPHQWAAMRSEATTRRKIDADAACVADFDCWANRHMRDANKACAPQIEQWAQYDFTWETTHPEARYTRAIMHNNGKQVSYLGDAIKFQNGFGNWVRASYSCTFEVATKAVVKLTVSEGRL